MSLWVDYLNDSGFIFSSYPQTILFHVILGKRVYMFTKTTEHFQFSLESPFMASMGRFPERTQTWDLGPLGSSVAKCSGWWVPFVRGIYFNCLNNVDLFCES